MQIESNELSTVPEEHEEKSSIKNHKTNRQDFIE